MSIGGALAGPVTALHVRLEHAADRPAAVAEGARDRTRSSRRCRTRRATTSIRILEQMQEGAQPRRATRLDATRADERRAPASGRPPASTSHEGSDDDHQQAPSQAFARRRPSLSLPRCSCGVAAQAQTDPLPSWNDGAGQAGDRRVRDGRPPTAGSPSFVPPAERIATFDQDGTLWVEHPMYSQVIYCLDRVPRRGQGRSPSLRTSSRSRPCCPAIARRSPSCRWRISRRSSSPR